MRQRTKKEVYALLAVGFGLLIGSILLLLGFVPQTDLNDYKRLTDGEGTTVQAVSTGAASSRISGRKGGSTQYCTSWRYELDGNEKFFTDRQDCYNTREQAPVDTTAELIYDPNDTGTMFVHSGQTLERLEGTKTMMRVLSVVGAVILAASILGGIAMRQSRRARKRKAALGP